MHCTTTPLTARFPMRSKLLLPSTMAPQAAPSSSAWHAMAAAGRFSPQRWKHPKPAPNSNEMATRTRIFRKNTKGLRNLSRKPLILLVGVAGFELATPCTP